MNAELGTLYGVGVGPGDPGLVTLKAVEVIRRVATVAFPVNREGAASRALDAVAGHIPETTARLPLLMPMTRDQQLLDSAHDAAVEAVIASAADGRDVACLALGDPLFYSTFGYIARRFPGPVEVVGGVSAISSMAAALGQPLADGDTPLVVVTGKAHDALESALAMDASVVIIKPRSLSSESLDLLDRDGAWDRARAAVELGGPDQRVINEIGRDTAAALPYFAILWIQPKQTEGKDD
ncbi:MAG: precorrin-2 C(20)-methyltransferase [Actinobacteria bacterium]|nr:precorrin-2 C(20)-methyltransferase [Actinomycetota bacterium]